MRPFVVVLLLCSTVMTFGQSSKQVFGPNARLPLNSAIKAGGLIYVSGTTPGAATASLHGDIEGQTTRTLDNIAATLKEAGSSIENAVSVMVYLRSATDFAAMNEVYSTYWPKDPPARTTVVLPGPNPFASDPNGHGVVEISMVAVPTGGERVVVHPSDWVRSPSPYSYGIKTGNTLFLSGLVSRNGRDNSTVRGDIAAQTKTILDNASAILAQAGMTYADVVSSRVFLTDDTSFQAMNTVYRRYFPAMPPARATVKAGLTTADYLIEITMVAVKVPGRKAFTTPNADGSAGTANPNLSSAIQAGNRLYVAGITGNTATNKADVKAQTTEALARIGRTLNAAGYDWDNVVDAIVYLPDMKKFDEMNAAYREVFKKDFPARTTVATGLMGVDAAVEIMLTAVR